MPFSRRFYPKRRTVIRAYITVGLVANIYSPRASLARAIYSGKCKKQRERERVERVEFNGITQAVNVNNV